MNIKKIIFFMLIIVAPISVYSMEMSLERRKIFVLKVEIGELKEKLKQIIARALQDVLKGKSIQEIDRKINDLVRQINTTLDELKKMPLEKIDRQFLQDAEIELKQILSPLTPPGKKKEIETLKDFLDQLYGAILSEIIWGRRAEQEEDEEQKKDYEASQERAKRKKENLEDELQKITKNFSEQMHNKLTKIRRLLQERNDIFDSVGEKTKRLNEKEQELKKTKIERDQKVILTSIKRLNENLEEDRRQGDALDKEISELSDQLEKEMETLEKKEVGIGERPEKKPGEVFVAPEYRVARTAGLVEQIRAEAGIPLEVLRRIDELKAQLIPERKIRRKITREYPGMGYETLVEIKKEERPSIYEAYGLGIKGIRPIISSEKNLIDSLTDLKIQLEELKDSFAGR